MNTYNKETPPSIVKTVQKKEDFFIEFTEEEMQTLDIKPHDKFEVEINDDQSIVLKKFGKLDIDLGDFDKETLETLISQSIELQVPVDEVIREALTSYLKKN